MSESLPQVPLEDVPEPRKDEDAPKPHLKDASQMHPPRIFLSGIKSKLTSQELEERLKDIGQ
jgi:hypothetical protein